MLRRLANLGCGTFVVVVVAVALAAAGGPAVIGMFALVAVALLAISLFR